MSENQIVVYQPNETMRLDVRLENETVRLNQRKIGELFGVDRTGVRGSDLIGSSYGDAAERRDDPPSLLRATADKLKKSSGWWRRCNGAHA
jgi:hypothetical protein